jgi:tRNA (mo5U34)-methyltransferase
MDRETLQKRIDAVPVWYHAIELAPGVVTPGEFDMRPFIDEFEFPDSFKGLTVVDVGASNGLFSFLFEKRGAEKVVAVDLESVADHDVPRWFLEQELERRSEEDLRHASYLELEAGFDLAKEVFNSDVEKRRCHVNRMGAAMPREFDFAFVGNLLHHLRDPVGALENVREVLKPGGKMILGCSCDLSVEQSYAVFWGSLDHVMWWVMSREAILRMCHLAGFIDVEWRGSFEFRPTFHPERCGIVGVIHAVAPEKPSPSDSLPPPGWE